MTDHYYEFEEGGTARAAAADKLVGQAASSTVQPGESFFRIRTNIRADEHVATAVVFDPPPPDGQRTPGRWDDFERPALYLSDDIELCLHECRTTIADEIVIATLTPTRELKVLDLTLDLPHGDSGPFSDANIFVKIMCCSRGRWLEFCREIARAALQAGYDGIRYLSYYSQAKQGAAAVNLALFGRPINDGSLKVTSVNRLQILDMKYAYRFGPALYHDSEMSAELAEMKNKLKESLAAEFISPLKPT